MIKGALLLSLLLALPMLPTRAVGAGVVLPTFADVPATYFAYPWIETLYAEGITGGCGTAPLIFCPESEISRAEMAVFLVRDIHGSGFVPPPATGNVFADVPANHPFGRWIEQIYTDGITSGCGTSPANYRPDDSVTRVEMAVFLLQAKYDAGYTPPPATGTVFNDVPIGDPFASWIEELAAEGITAGCGDGNYCPDSAVTRGQMAIFLVRAFPGDFPVAGMIRCGAVLGPGGTFVLDRDLTCHGSLEKYGPGVLNVRTGASLNMNGHTVTCDNRGWGIRVDRATLLNGTVRGCGTAVIAGESVVERMTFIDNYGGVWISGEQSSGHNFIIGNIAMHGNIGFYAEDAGPNTFANNVATGNESFGFLTNSDDVFVGNVADANQGNGFTAESGCSFWPTPACTIFNGNVARNNGGTGFRSTDGGGVFVGNVAQGNGAHGFDLGEYDSLMELTAKENVADSNAGDGFLLRYIRAGSEPRPLRALTSNRAVNNGGSGIHVLDGNEFPPQGPTDKFLNITVTGNTALGNAVDLAGDDPNCLEVLWQGNVFLTKSPDCIQ